MAGGLLIVFKAPMLVKYQDNPELRVLSLLRTPSLKHCTSPHSVLTIVAILFSHTSADDSSSFRNFIYRLKLGLLCSSVGAICLIFIDNEVEFGPPHMDQVG